MPDDSQMPLPTSSPSGAANPSPSPLLPAANMHKSRKTTVLLVSLLLLVLIAAGTVLWVKHGSHKTAKPIAASVAKSTTDTVASSAPAVAGLQLDTHKNYGNKYASGLLPVGDNKYVASGGQKGSIYLCNSSALVPASQAGAQVRGPWFTSNNTEWNMYKKAAIAGSVSWTPSLQIALQNGKRVITTNDLPSHLTGVFPVAASDPARMYDANPNAITAQALTYSLTADPSPGTPQCVGGEVGVMTTGVALFDGFDAGGRDAGAWEVQDSCGGHPQNKGEYHYHTLSSCITDTSVQTVIGYALDGFAITGPTVSSNNILTTNDLDECHGIVSQIKLDGKLVTKYHYVMTQDFPYSVGCFRAVAVQAPGLPEGGNAKQGRPPAN